MNIWDNRQKQKPSAGLCIKDYNKLERMEMLYGIMALFLSL